MHQLISRLGCARAELTGSWHVTCYVCKYATLYLPIVGDSELGPLA